MPKPKICVCGHSLHSHELVFDILAIVCDGGHCNCQHFREAKPAVTDGAPPCKGGEGKGE